MKSRKTRVASAVLCAALLALPACALAGDTAPLTLSTQQDVQFTPRRQDAGQLEKFGHRRAYLGVSASDGWLYQARIGGLMLNLRLYTPDGEGVTFQEKLCAAQTGGEKDIRLCIRQGSRDGGLMLQFDQHAIDVLSRVGITEIVLADFDFYIQVTYPVADLAAMRDALGLSAGEQLCLTGENAPLTVVSEDGVRRQIAQ